MRNILLKIAYDGSDFSGWQRQTNARTVQGEIENALSLVLGRPMTIDGTSRTDAGVHAYGQCASFQLPDGGIPTAHIPKALNDILAFDRLEGIGDVRILSAREMPEGFHARRSSLGKRYIYRIYNGKEKSPLRRTRFYQIDRPLDIDAMRQGAEYLKGTHDFKAFESAGSTVHETTVRTIYRLEVAAEGPDVTLIVEGDGFLYNMVRIITGTLVEVGLHKKKPEDVEMIIKGRDRGKAGHLAPPQGLYLDEVFYDKTKLG